MTTKAPKPKADEDEAQRRRFIETAKALEADGDLSFTEGKAASDRLFKKALSGRCPTEGDNT
jgi:hypothetical protein